jgi:MerR family transcriptional regulator/heat shock protein HspR
MTFSDSEPKYVISIAARIVGIESHTLRYYEKLGLVQPYRSDGNIRYYSERDIEQLKRVKSLISDLGVNPAGAEVVVRMAEKLADLQGQVEQLVSENNELRRQLENMASTSNKK